MSRLSSGNQRNGPDVSIIVVSYNTAHLLPRMFSALEAARGSMTLQIIVVDNASADGSVEILRSNYPDVVLIANDTNVGFGRANNQALTRVQAPYVLLLNTDAFVAPDTLRKTIDFMDANQSCGVLGVKLVGENGDLQPSCRYFPTPWRSFLASSGLRRLFPNTRLVDDVGWPHTSVRECDWVPGCYYLTRRSVIDQVGLFDPRYFLYFEEVDHCRAVQRAGWRVMFYPFTEVIHVGGESAVALSAVSPISRQVSALQIESELLYFRKHYGLSGALSAVGLGIVDGGIKLLSAMVKHRNTARAGTAIRHTATLLKIFAATGLASRATR